MNSQCLVWTGPIDQDGYGRTWFDGKPYLAHRAAYERARGPIPEGMTLDHLCRNRACCNPDHLEPVTQAENVRRAVASRTHCRNGHEWTPANTYLPPGRTRQCRTCLRAAAQKYQERKKALA